MSTPIVLKNMDPVPVSASDLSDAPIHGPSQWHRKILPPLRAIQKYSTLVFSEFAFLHLLNTAILPALNISAAEDFMMMTREFHQIPAIETFAIAGSALLHVISGITIRLIQRSRPKPHLSELKAEIELNRSKSVLKDDAAGTGGWAAVFNFGLRRSVVYKKLGLTPLQFSGYTLLPTLLYHVFKQRLAPLLVDGDSSLINLGYVGHAMTKDSFAKTYIGLIFLVYVGTYHFVTGSLKWMKVYSRRAKTVWFLVINAVTLFAGASLYRISSLGAESGSVGRAFDSYLAYPF